MPSGFQPKTYTAQPGTIPHRVIAWLRDKVSKGEREEWNTVEICDELDLDVFTFHRAMDKARYHQAVKVTHKDGRRSYWSLPEKEARNYRPIREGSLRVAEWEDKVIVTGVEIVNGAAVFTKEQFAALQGEMK